MGQPESDTHLPETFAATLVDLVGVEARELILGRRMAEEAPLHLNREEHLRASHCKPWRDATNEERLDGENGLLLTPNADHLFDRGFIGFEDNGDVLISPVAHAESLGRMGLDSSRPLNVGPFAAGQRRYLEFHRENVLLRSRFLDSG